jgi:hypothetical protein
MLKRATIMTYMGVPVDEPRRNIEPAGVANLRLLAPGVRRARSDVTHATVENRNLDAIDNLP